MEMILTIVIGWIVLLSAGYAIIFLDKIWSRFWKSYRENKKPYTEREDWINAGMKLREMSNKIDKDKNNK